MKITTQNTFYKFLLLLLLTYVGQAKAQNYNWAKNIGGTNNEEGKSITVDASGNVYTTGYFEGTVDFDPNEGIANLTSTGGQNIFVSKLDPSGNLVWAKRMGGYTYGNIGNSIAVDASGNVYITGEFKATVNFDPNTGTANLTAAGDQDIFISKLDASGNLVWAKRMGGTSADKASGIAIDALGNVYTTGYFMGTADFDPNAGTANLTSVGVHDIFVSKLDALGNYVWAKHMGNSDMDLSFGIAVDALGNVYITGEFWGTVDFDPNVGTANLTSIEIWDIFVSKLDASGNLVWAKSMGGAGVDIGHSITVDSLGNVYTTGSFERTVDFDPNAGTANLTAIGLNDIFVSKLDALGNYVWAKSMGGTDSDIGRSIAVDALGNVYTTGPFQGTADFDPNAGTFNLTSVGAQDIFVSKLDALGNYVWAKSMGSPRIDYGYGIAADVSGNVYTTGSFMGTVDFDPNVDTANLTSVGAQDIFVSKLSPIPPTMISIYPNPTQDMIYVKVPVVGKLKITLIDSQGKEIKKDSYEANDMEQKFPIDMKGKSHGIYFIKIETEKGQTLKKIIKI